MVIGRDNRGVAVIGLKTGLEDLGIIVLAHGLACGLGLFRTAHNAMHQRVLIDLQFEHGIKLQAFLCEHHIQGFGLRDGAREAIEDEAFFGIRLLDPVRDNADDDFIRHQPARFHDGLGFQANRRARGNRCTQHVAGGELRYPEFFDQTCGLCAFSRSGRSQQDQSQRRLPRNLDFLTSPSY